MPRGRLQIESGYTFAHDLTATTNRNTQDFPELSTRYGLTRWLEFRTFWTGATYSRTISRTGKPTVNQNGFSDTEFGFKSQLLVGDKERIWRPTTALITSVIAPTGGNSPFGSQQVERLRQPDLRLESHRAFSIAGSSAFLGVRLYNPGLPGASPPFGWPSRWWPLTRRRTERHSSTSGTSSSSSAIAPGQPPDPLHERRPPLPGLTHQHPDRPPRGFGLGDRPDDFFTGAGYSIRF